MPAAGGSPALRRAAVWALLATLFVVFLSLAAWQVQRRSWKLALIERVEQRAHGQPQPLSLPASWPNLTAAQAEYQPVAVSGTWLPQHTILSQAVTELGAGFWVMTPLQQADGSRVWINRGFVPEDQRATWLPSGDRPADNAPLQVQGLWRANEPDGGFLRHNDPAAGRWYSRDVVAMAQAQKLTNASPFFIDAGSPGAPRDAANSAAEALNSKNAAAKSAENAAENAKAAGDAATKVIEEGVAEKLTEMQNIQKDVSTKAQTAETAAKNADTAKTAAQNAQKAAEKSAGNAANSESAAKNSAEQAAAARDTAQELAGRVTVDDTLSDASASPVQNKVIFAALAKKQDVQRVTFVINDTDGGLDAVVAD